MSAIEIMNCEQGSDEWFAARLGLPTASEFHTVMASGKGGKGTPSLTRQLYLDKLAGEIISGKPMENYTNAAMQRGKDQEDEARRLYRFMRNVDPTQVGFIKSISHNTGCSPDALIDADGMLEIKTKAAHLIVKAVREGRETPPPEHLLQCQGNLWVAQRKWIDLALYCPGMPFLVSRIYRDEAVIAGLQEGVGSFNRDLAALVAQVRAAQ